MALDYMRVFWLCHESNNRITLMLRDCCVQGYPPQQQGYPGGYPQQQQYGAGGQPVYVQGGVPAKKNDGMTTCLTAW